VEAQPKGHPIRSEERRRDNNTVITAADRIVSNFDLAPNVQQSADSSFPATSLFLNNPQHQNAQNVNGQ
jgi:hypothetical protein